MHIKAAKYISTPPTKAPLEASYNNINRQQQFTASSQQEQQRLTLNFLTVETKSNERQNNDNSQMKGRFLHLNTLDEAINLLNLPVGAINHRSFNSYQKYKTTNNNETLFAQIKSMELSIIDLVLLSTISANDHKFDLALTLARESLGVLNGIKVILIQQQQQLANRINNNSESNKVDSEQVEMTTNVSLFELGLLVNSNLAAQLKNRGQLRESIELYTSLCKMAPNLSGFPSMMVSQSLSSTSNHFNFIHDHPGATSDNNDEGSNSIIKYSKKNTRSSTQYNTAGGVSDNVSSQQQYETRSLLHKFGLNIGNIYYQLADYKRALKYYRLTLDRLSSMTNLNQQQSTSSSKLIQQHEMRQLKLKLMNNIGLTLLTNSKINNDKQESLTSLNLILSDNLVMSSRLVNNQQQLYQTSSENHEQPNTNIYSCHNSNHHRFGLNLMIAYETCADLAGMMGALKSLVKVDICHQYERLFNNVKNKFFSKCEFVYPDTGDKGEEKASFLTSTTKVMKEIKPKLKINGSHSGLLRALETNNNIVDDEVGIKQITNSSPISLVQINQEQIKRQDDSFSNNLDANQMSSKQFEVKQEKYFPQQIVEDSTTKRFCLNIQTSGEFYSQRKIRQVIESIQKDKLERLIEEKNIQILQCILMSCNLMLQLEAKLKMQKKNDYKSPTTSVFDFCSELFSTKLLYKGLIYDLRLSKAIQLLDTNQNYGLNEAIKIMNLVDAQQKEQANFNVHNNTWPQTNIVATNLTLLNLFKSTSSIYRKDKNDLSKLNLAIDLANIATNMNSSCVANYINLANCYYHRGNFELAKEIYEKRVLVACEDQWEASYNLNIINRFYKSFCNNNNNIEKDQNEKVLYLLQKDIKYQTKLFQNNLMLSCIQLALAYKDNNNIEKSISTIKDLIANKKQAPEVYLLVSKLLNNSNDSQTVLNAYDKNLANDSVEFLKQAFKEHPYYLPILERLIALSINKFDYKNAKKFIINCIKNKPDQVLWYQMLAECYRRDANYIKAMKLYKLAVDKFPKNTSCLKALIKLTQELGLDSENKMFSIKLAKLIN